MIIKDKNVLVLVVLSWPLPSLYRQRFSRRENWPVFQIRRLQMQYIPKKQKGRKLQKLNVSCNYSKQAVGRYLPLHMLGEYKWTSWFCSSSFPPRKDQVAVPSCCLSACTSLLALLSRWPWRAARATTCADVECVVSQPVLYVLVSLTCLIFVRQSEKASWFAAVVF